MKVYFDADGSLTVEGENATEWLALNAWVSEWLGGKAPLWVRVREYDVADTTMSPPPLRWCVRQLKKN